jgi:hypothetical protein
MNIFAAETVSPSGSDFAIVPELSSTRTKSIVESSSAAMQDIPGNAAAAIHTKNSMHKNSLPNRMSLPGKSRFSDKNRFPKAGFP